MKVHNDFLLVNLAQCVHIEPRSKEVSFNTQGIFSFVRYYRKETEAGNKIGPQFTAIKIAFVVGYNSACANLAPVLSCGRI